MVTINKCWKVWAALVVIFVAGLAVGGVGSFLAARHFIKGQIMNVARADTQAMTNTLMRGLDHHLHMTREQEEALRPIVVQGVEEAWAIRAKVRPQVVAIMQRTLARARPVLTPEQCRILERHLELVRSAGAAPPED